MTEESKEEVEVYVPDVGFDRIQTQRGESRHSHVTVGSWWAPKVSSKPKEMCAYRIENLIPSLPMNKVRISRNRVPEISINALINGWDPVTVDLSQVKERERAPRKKRADSLSERVARLEEENSAIRADLDMLMTNLGVKKSDG